MLAADKLMMNPRLYATFLLWLLSELFEELPEVGDPDKPKLVFFFDEAHLLFNDAPKVLIERVEQVVRLIRSKGVGVYFVTQNPLDVPETVLAQLGNRVQHALRAYTPREQKAVKTAAETFRPNPAFDCATVITNLGTGEALVSTLGGQGRAVDGRAHADPPALRPRRPGDGCRAPADHGQRARLPASMTRISTANPPSRCWPHGPRRRPMPKPPSEAQEEAPQPPGGTTSGWTLPGFGGGNDDDNQGRGQAAAGSGYQRETVVEAAMKSVARTVATAARPGAGARDFGELEAVADHGLWEMKTAAPVRAAVFVWLIRQRTPTQKSPADRSTGLVGSRRRFPQARVAGISVAVRSAWL